MHCHSDIEKEQGSGFSSLLNTEEYGANTTFQPLFCPVSKWSDHVD